MIPWRVPARYHQKFQKQNKKGGFEKQNVHMNGGYVFQMNTLHITVYMKTDHYTYLWHKIPFTQDPFHSEQGGILF